MQTSKAVRYNSQSRAWKIQIFRSGIFENSGTYR